jgi:hypothetical protein
MTFHFGFLASAKVFSAILPQFARTGCNDFFTTFSVKNRLPKAWHGHVLGSGGHQTDNKPASVLANKPQ